MRYSDISEAVYHGTASAFTTFAFRKSDSHPSKIGIWFTSDVEVAKGFAGMVRRMADDEPRLISAEIRLQQPKIFEDYAAFLELFRESGDAARMRKYLMRQGHDGIQITRSTTDGFPERIDYAVFDKHQIDIVGSEVISK